MTNQTEQDYLHDMAAAVTRHKGFQFNSDVEAEQHIRKAAQEIQQQLVQDQALFVEGLRCLSQDTHRMVRDICQSLLLSHDQPEMLAQIYVDEIAANPRALEQFSEAVNGFYDCGDFQQEHSVISVFLTLFPLHPQPYACLATLIWRRDGIQAAQNFYEHIVDVFKNPLLDYFSADCFLKSGHAEKAKPLLQRAYRKAQDTLDQYAAFLIPRINNALMQCS